LLRSAVVGRKEVAATKRTIEAWVLRTRKGIQTDDRGGGSCWLDSIPYKAASGSTENDAGQNGIARNDLERKSPFLSVSSNLR
jgi:hypothetical protein